MATPPPPLTVDLAPADIILRLDALARRGKLADFHPAENGSAAFVLTAYGQPFDYTLTATASADGPRTTISYSLRQQRKAPVITILVIVFTIWPGVWLTDSMLKTYWDAYRFPTWIWYLPLTVLPLPWMWMRMARRSQQSAEVHSAELAEAIRAELARPA